MSQRVGDIVIYIVLHENTIDSRNGRVYYKTTVFWGTSLDYEVRSVMAHHPDHSWGRWERTHAPHLPDAETETGSLHMMTHLVKTLVKITHLVHDRSSIPSRLLIFFNAFYYTYVHFVHGKIFHYLLQDNLGIKGVGRIALFKCIKRDSRKT